MAVMQQNGCDRATSKRKRKRKQSSPAADPSVLVVDDHPTIRGALRITFATAGIGRLAEAVTGAEALQLLDSQPVDVVLLDLSLTSGDGLEVLRQIKSKHPAIGVLVHSHHDEMSTIARSYELGADGYLVKGLDTHVLVDAVRTVGAGDTAWSEEQMTSVRRMFPCDVGDKEGK